MTIKNILAVIMIFLVSDPAISQNPDSLNALLEDKEGRNRIEILYQLAYNCMESDLQLALRFSREGYTLAVQAGDSIGIVKNGSMLGSSLRRLQKIDSAILIYHTYLPVAKRLNHPKYAVGLNSLGISYMFRADYDKALGSFFESLELRKITGDTSSQILVLHNIGIVYYKLRDYQKALGLFRHCHDMQKRTGDFDDAALITLNAGLACVFLGKYQEAMNYIDTSLEFCGKDCSQERNMQTHYAKGLIYHGLGSDEIAEGYFLKSYLIARMLGDIRHQLDNIDYLSQIYMDHGNFENAASYLHSGELLIANYPSFRLESIKIYSRLSELFRDTKDYQMASHYQFKYALLKDSVYSDELTNNLMRTEAEYLEKKNLEQIASQQQIISLSRDIIRRKNAINIMSIILALISAGLVLVLYINYHQKKRLNDLLDGKITERTKQLSLSHEQLVSALHERDLMLKRSGKIHFELANRVEGLCLMGLKEVSDPVARVYMLEIGALTKEHARVLRLTHSSITEWDLNGRVC